MAPRTIMTLSLLGLLTGCGATSTAEPAPTIFTAPTAPTALPAATAAAPATTAVVSVPSAAPEMATPAAATGAALDQLNLTMEQLAPTFDSPLYLTNAGDGSGRLFVVEKPGRVITVAEGARAETPFLDITDRVGSNGSEQGLLSVAFDPKFADTGRLFVNYTNQAGNTVISRFDSDGTQADPASEAVLLEIEQPYSNHNGGLIKFGPDGYLYIGMGDGGSAGDPQGNAQNGQSLLGKMLRIDVSGDAYAIPSDNPFADGGAARPEIWATGVRNPWRFSFDRATGALFIADVGQNQYEEVNLQPAGQGGLNYGWNTMEAQHCFRSPDCDTAGLVLPIGEYSHDFGCSITGGYVYRGTASAALTGTYLFADYCSGRIWGMQEVTPGSWQQTELANTGMSISSFGEDEAGEVYITNISDGTIYRLAGQ